MSNERPHRPEVAMDMLSKVEQQQAYSNSTQSNVEKHKFHRLEAGLATEIVYGTIQRRIRLIISSINS